MLSQMTVQLPLRHEGVVAFIKGTLERLNLLVTSYMLLQISVLGKSPTARWT